MPLPSSPQLPPVAATSLYRTQMPIPARPTEDASDRKWHEYTVTVLGLFAPHMNKQHTWSDFHKFLFGGGKRSDTYKPLPHGQTWKQLFEEAAPHLSRDMRCLLQRANTSAETFEKQRVSQEKSKKKKALSAEEAKKAKASNDKSGKAAARTASVPSEVKFRRGGGRVLWLQLNEAVFLHQQMRCEDETYLAMLSRLREGFCTPADYRYLQQFVLGEKEMRPDADGRFPLALVTRNHLRTALNDQGTASLAAAAGTPLLSWDALDRHGKRPVDADLRRILLDLPDNATENLPGTFSCMPDMPVMLTHNIAPELGLNNGTRATLLEIVVDKDTKKTRKDNGSYELDSVPLYVKVRVQPRPGDVALDFGLGENIVPIFPRTKSFKTELHVVGTPAGDDAEHSFNRTQIPLIPLFAMTDYKSQGQSMKTAVIDLARPPPPYRNSAASLYVLLSRLRTGEGLHILRDFPEDVLPTSGVNPEQQLEIARLQMLFEQTKLRHAATEEQRTRAASQTAELKATAKARDEQAAKAKAARHEAYEAAMRLAHQQAAEKNAAQRRHAADLAQRSSYAWSGNSCHLDSFLEAVWAARAALQPLIEKCPKPAEGPDSTVEDVVAVMRSYEIPANGDVSDLVLLLLWHRQHSGVCSTRLRDVFRNKACGTPLTTDAVAQLPLEEALAMWGAHSADFADVCGTINQGVIPDNHVLSMALLNASDVDAAFRAISSVAVSRNLALLVRWYDHTTAMANNSEAVPTTIRAKNSLRERQQARLAWQVRVHAALRAKLCAASIDLAPWCDGEEGNVVAWIEKTPRLFSLTWSLRRDCPLHVRDARMRLQHLDLNGVPLREFLDKRLTPTDPQKCTAVTVRATEESEPDQLCNTRCEHTVTEAAFPPILAVGGLHGYPSQVSLGSHAPGHRLVSLTRGGNGHFVAYCKDESAWYFYDDLRPFLQPKGITVPQAMQGNADYAFYIAE